MVAVEHVTEAGKMLIRITGLWEGTTKQGSRYLTGGLSETSRLLVFTNRRKTEASDPDWLAYIGTRSEGGGLIRVAPLWNHTGKDGREFLSGPWGSARILIFTNGFRTRSSEPSHVAYWAPRDPARKPSTAASNQATSAVGNVSAA
jgi:hypothetical protein